MKFILITVTLSFTLCACQFDGLFLYPNKIPEGTKRISQISPTKNDTTLIYIGDGLQPFVMNGKNIPKYPEVIFESVLFKSKNGNQLNGWFMQPMGGGAEINILLLHGNAGNIATQFKGILPLVRQGFNVFLFDYSGFGFSEGEATRKDVLLDANAALDYLVDRSKGNKIVVYGQSLGGNLAGKLVEQNREKVNAMVAEGAFSSHKDIAAKSASLLGRIFVSEGYSIKKSIENIQVPVLIIHSTEDETIPFKMAEKIFKRANDPKELYAITKCHMCGPMFYEEEIGAKIKQMLK